MPAALKVVIAVITAGFLITVAGLAFGLYWWSTNKDQFLASAKAISREGAIFGQSVDQQACVDSALARHRANSSPAATIWTGLYVRGCLQSSRVTPGFCRSIPSPANMLNTVRWRMHQCEQVGLVDNNCHHVMGAVQRGCHPHP